MEDRQWELLNKIHEIDKRVLALELKKEDTVTITKVAEEKPTCVTNITTIKEEPTTPPKKEEKGESKTEGFFQNKEVRGFLIRAFITIGGLLVTMATGYLTNSGGDNETKNNSTVTVPSDKQ